jgi:exopolysaccharide biosynthesis protein
MNILNFFKKPYRWAGLYAFLLTGAFVFVLLDTFVIPKSYAAAAAVSSEGTVSPQATEQTSAVTTGNTYQDENIAITIEPLRQSNTTVYVADVKLSDASFLKTALASNTFGRNIKETTSEMAEDQNAIFAINGDYYGFRDSGYVLRNGIAYRDTARASGDDEALVIDEEGNFSIVRESEVSMDSLMRKGAWQILSFGPALVENGEISVTARSEVDQAMQSNPRTAIGQIDALHYVLIVSDGRTAESEGLSLLELARIFQDLGCTTAYNLDGGGSSTMVFNGEIVNSPTGGKGASERKVSDIVYLGY